MTNKCVLCTTELNDHNRTTEHILLNCLGGRITSDSIICSSCNNKYGSGIDSDLCNEVATIRAIAGFKSGTGKDAPRHRFPKSKAVLKGDGTLETKVNIETQESHIGYKYKAEGQPDKVIPILKQILKAKGVDEHTSQQIIKQQEFSLKPFDEKLHFSITGPKILPSIYKQSLTLIAKKLGNEVALSEAFNNARTIIKDGIETEHGTNWWRDSRRNFNSPSFDNYGCFYNLLRITSDKSGKVFGYFGLYNLIGYIFILAERDGPKNIDFHLVNDPANPTKYTVSDATQPNPDLLTWLSEPYFNMEDMKKRFGPLNKLHTERRYSFDIKQRINHVIANAVKNEVPQNDWARLITAEFLPDIARATQKNRENKMHEIFSTIEN